MSAEHFILIPLTRPGGGTGHLRRVCTLANDLSKDGKHCILVLDNPSRWSGEIENLQSNVDIVTEETIFKTTLEKKNDNEVKSQNAIFNNNRLLKKNWPPTSPMHNLSVIKEPDDVKSSNLLESFNNDKILILVDARATSVNRLKDLALHGCPILLDDDGPAEKYAPLLIDCIPRPGRIVDTTFLNLPPLTREPDPGGPILVCFGGEDPAGLTEPVLNYLLNVKGIPAQRISTVSSVGKYSGVSTLNVSHSLKNRLNDFGLVICSFGLTAFEAIAAGCAVITFNPGRYHTLLSRYTGFPDVGYVRKRGMDGRHFRRLKQLLNKPGILVESSNLIRNKWDLGKPRKSLANSLQKVNTPRPVCAACGSLLPPVKVRLRNRSYYRCNQCGMIGLYRFDFEEDEYRLAYFMDEYKKQYGKTYLEDFESIKSMGITRLMYIQRLRKQGYLLDIGCAFGPFMEAAAENGYRVYGMDVSGEAVSWVKNKLGLSAFQGNFPDVDLLEVFGVEFFDVVSLWYVIEHFPNLEPVLEKISSIVKKGGILALSTPHGAGISAKKSFKRFLKNSPRDHYTIWTPKSAQKILKKWGFRIARIRITGHHPERFYGKIRNNSLLYKILMMISRMLRFGDTFEIYAVKVSQ